MKFLDANGLALFTKKIFNKFVSNVSGADNKITITKGDGTKNEINLNEVLKTDEIAENPPEDDNTLKIPSTSWVQSFLNYLFSIESANTDNIKSKIKSWAQEQINSWLETLGIRYNIAQNGYICLGKLFGDAIIQWGLVNILQNQQTIIKELNISWSYCIACACVLEEAGQFSLIKWLDKQSNGHSIKFMSQNKVTDENGVWFSFIGIGKY